MKYYIVVAMDVDLQDSTISALDIVQTLLDSGFWAFSVSAPVKEKLVEGDCILFYVGGKGRHYFVATGIVKAPLKTASNEQKSLLNNLGISFFSKTININEIEWFQTPVELIPLKEQLSFIADKKNYGLSLRLPIREILKEDYLLIIRSNDSHL